MTSINNGASVVAGLNNGALLRNKHIETSRIDDFYAKITEGRNRGKHIPCVSVTLQKLLAIDASSEISAQELAEIILDDYGLISKVLQAVNTFYYNRLGHKITTVTQAVILLGFNAIRKIAVSLSIIDILPDTGNRAAAEIMASAFMAAHLATALDGKVSADPEETFIATLFKPLARLFTAIHDPDFYTYIKSIEGSFENQPEKLAEVQKFWKHLGDEIANSWHIPDSISCHLEGRSVLPEMEHRQQIVEMSCKIAESFIGNKPLDAIMPLVENLEELTGTDVADLAVYLEESVSRTVKNAEAFAVILEDVHPSLTLAPAIHNQEGGLSDLPPSDTALSEAHAGMELVMELACQMVDVILSRTFSLNQIFMLAVEMMKRGVGLENVILCLFDTERSTLTARFGLGCKAEELRQRLVIESPLDNCLVRKAMEQDVEALGTWSELLSESISELDNIEVCVSPLRIKGRNIGCFFTDMGESRRFMPLDMKTIGMFRRLVVVAAE